MRYVTPRYDMATARVDYHWSYFTLQIGRGGDSARSELAYRALSITRPPACLKG